MKQALSIRSDFSIGDSLLQVDKLVARAKDLGYDSLALTDLGSIHAMPDFSARCTKAGIKPIIAVTLRVHDDATYRKPKGDGPKQSPSVQLKVFVLEEKGLHWLMRALSKANSADRFYYTARNAWEDFDGAEGIAVSTGDFYGLFSHEQARDRLIALAEMIGMGNVYIELSPINTPLFDTMNQKAIEAGRERGFQFILTYPALYTEPSDASSLDVLGLIPTQGRVSDPWNPKQYVREFHLQEPGHIIPRLKDAALRQAKFNGIHDVKVWVDAMQGTKRLTDRVNYKFSKMPVNLPTMASNEFAQLVQECKIGWNERFSRPIMGYKPDFTDPTIEAKYKGRLKYELKVLRKMGFSGYFLLTQEIVQWSKKNGIIVGPGRGSIGGSLVAYLMGIADVDPIRFDLLFERFINPDRLDLPDADLDFMSSRRHEVIGFLQKKYGMDHVAGISNYSTMASASALRDAGRVFGLTGLEMSASKLVPKEHGQPVTLTEAAAQVPEIEHFALTNPTVWKHALVFEGCMRSFGQHAAGVVVSRDPLVERAVVETRTEMPVVCWDKRTVEDFGLVKLDILGLSTLDVLAIAKQYIKSRHATDVDYLSIPLGEADIMESFGRGDTTGVFQFESGGMRALLKNLAKGGTLTFDDITAATALYRPGPMDSGLLEDFVNIKQGNRLPSYDHPLMEPALKDTYSVIVYQEQVMQVAVDLAGFTRTEADHLRKAMGKKDKDKMAEMRQKWIDGCFKTAGMNDTMAGALFDKIEAFAGYGFNKSHAVEYSVISYWTMWLRVRYPAEYFAACLSIVAEDKLPGLVKDARDYGIEIMPPDVNLSGSKFMILDDKHILAPFNAVLGCSDTIANKIVELRKRNGGKFSTDEEFREAAAQPGTKVNSRVVDRLDQVGALALITPGALPPRHIDRRKAQTELMPGLIIDVVKATRFTDMTDGFGKAKLVHIVQDYSKCQGCTLKDNPHPTIRIPKSKVRYMVVTDSPTWQEEKAGKLLVGDAAEAMKAAIVANGLEVGEGYYTCLVKSKKTDKFLANEQINGCKKFLEQEIDIVKPAVIVALGSAAIKFLVPDVKGGTAELAGKVIYDSKREASIVCGINPQQVHFDADKLDVLKDVFMKVAEILD